MRIVVALFVVVLAALSPRPAHPSLPGLPDSADAAAFAERLGFEPGSRHPHHYELLRFYRELARSSDRVRIETIGHTHGGREHVLVYFARPERLADLERIRDGRVQASRDGEGPPVVWLGYSVHGNEASGASAAPLVAWYLATSDDERVRRWLDEMVIVMEPMINPDGLDRFAHWANMHRGRNPSADPNDREHNEAWPNGRTSYYWFDLNRDWLPLTHPVSRQRIAHYRQWRPHVLTDAHEMGHDSSYFFQPGIPERNNPATPGRVFELTTKIARYHGEILDEAGEPYYSRESFDDYYLGKGSTYPDLTGGIGILFEQGSARGHRMDTPYGVRTFADAIANHVRTSISTLDAAADLSGELIAHQAEFFSEAREMAGRGGWLIGDDGDPARAARLLGVLLGHGIRVHELNETVTIDGSDFAPGRAWAIPADQDQYRFIRAIFDTPTELPMETFYDVSAWPLQHAFDLPLSAPARLPSLGDRLTEGDLPTETGPEIDADAPAWAVAWDQHRVPAVLAGLLADGYRVQVAEKPLTLATGDGPVELGRGSLLIHAGIQPNHLEPVHEALGKLAAAHRVRVAGIRSGLAREGLDAGSPSVPVLEAPRPALLTGDGVSSYGAGYVWHYFDQMLDRPITHIDGQDLPGDLSDYTHVILPPGRYESMPDSFAAALVEFVQEGGQLIALGNSASWVESLDLGWQFTAENGEDKEEDEDQDSQDPAGPARYADFEKDFARTLIGGSALAVQIDVTHPLVFGYRRNRLTTFRQGAHVLKTSENRYATPGRYAETPLVAGYLSDKVAEKLAGTPSVAADRLGHGLVVRIADDPLFRGYWAGSERLFVNALFYGQLVEPTRMPD